MLEKEEYNKFACKLEGDLNERFTRIKWKVDGYDERLKCATKTSEMWARYVLTHTGDSTITMTPEEAFKDSMNSFHIGFSIRINETRLTGDTEMDGRLITDSSADAISIIGEMVAHEIANELLVE